MRLDWSERAVADLEGVAARAPRGAAHIYESVVWLSTQQFPSMFRRAAGRPKDHVLVIAPYVVLYRADGTSLTVLRVLDGRRERDGV